MDDTKTSPVASESSNGSKHWRTPRTNRDWWPNQLDLQRARTRTRPLGDPMGEDFDYAEEFATLDLDGAQARRDRG